MIFVQTSDPNISRIPSVVKQDGILDIWVMHNKAYIPLLRNLEDVTVLEPSDVRRIVTARNDLGANHPLQGEYVSKGPFLAGWYPGDPRMNVDGSVDCYVNGQWVPYIDTEGAHIIPEIITR